MQLTLENIIWIAGSHDGYAPFPAAILSEAPPYDGEIRLVYFFGTDYSYVFKTLTESVGCNTGL